MKNDNILYQIKSLEKLAIKSIISSNEFDDKFFSCKPTPTQMQIMGYILKNKHVEVYQKDLEHVLKLSRATVSGVLHTMEKNNLIERVNDSQDTRTKKVKLTQNAKEMFDKNKLKWEELEKVAKDGIDQKEIENFIMTIEKMKENIEKNYFR